MATSEGESPGVANGCRHTIEEKVDGLCLLCWKEDAEHWQARAAAMQARAEKARKQASLDERTFAESTRNALLCLERAEKAERLAEIARRELLARAKKAERERDKANNSLETMKDSIDKWYDAQAERIRSKKLAEAVTRLGAAWEQTRAGEGEWGSALGDAFDWLRDNDLLVHDEGATP